MMFRMLFIALLILFLPYQRVFAQPTPTPPPSYINIDVVEGLEACDGGDAKPGQRCRIDGDLPNPTFVPGSDKAHCHEVETEVTNPITGKVSTIITIECVNQQTHVRDDNFLWSSQKDAGNYDLFNLFTMLEQARLPLTPSLIWAETTRNTNLQQDSWIARGCTYSRQTNQPTILEKNELSKQIMTLTDPYIPSIVENLEYTKSIWSTAKTLDQYYQKASELVRPGTAYDCGYGRDATNVIRDVKDSGGKAEFTLLEIIKKTILFILEETSGTFKVITETSRKPNSEEMFGGMVQAKPEYFLNSRISQNRKDAISANAGIVETFRPCELEFEGPDINGEVLNEYEWETSGDTFEIESRQHGMKLVDESTNYLQSTLLPASLQEERHKKKLSSKPCGGQGIPPEPITSDVDNPPAPSCKDGIDEEGFTIVPGNLEAAITAATAGKIPRCVLQGVANIEGAANEIASGKCSPNQCSATGPFQITVGFTYSGSGASCEKDTSCKACGLTSCPNAIKDFVPGTNPCDTQSAAKAAVSMLVVKSKYFGKTLNMTGDKDAIIVAGDSYYGLPIPIEKFGGCSYGEWIYKDACGNSNYTCKAHSLPPAP